MACRCVIQRSEKPRMHATTSATYAFERVKCPFVCRGPDGWLDLPLVDRARRRANCPAFLRSYLGGAHGRQADLRLGTLGTVGAFDQKSRSRWLDRCELGRWRRGGAVRAGACMAAFAGFGHAAGDALGASGVLAENARPLGIVRALRG